MERIKEPSTWAGIGAALAAFHPVISAMANAEIAWGFSGLGMLAGGVAVWLRERPGK